MILPISYRSCSNFSELSSGIFPRLFLKHLPKIFLSFFPQFFFLNLPFNFSGVTSAIHQTFIFCIIPYNPSGIHLKISPRIQLEFFYELQYGVLPRDFAALFFLSFKLIKDLSLCFLTEFFFSENHRRIYSKNYPRIAHQSLPGVAFGYL